MDRTLQELLRTLESQVCELPLAIPVARDARSVNPSVDEDDGRESLSLLELVTSAECNPSEDSSRLSVDFVGSLHQAQALATAPACPIVAILGMLNAGKSSLVATFLGSTNEPNCPSPNDHRSRVLIGSANSQGTHRFVLWLPHSWKANAGVWGFVQQQLRSVFGSECEALSESPEQAAVQYNDVSPRPVTDRHGRTILRSPMEIPLVATDPNLDRLGIALMDCPDVQTGILHRGTEAAGIASRYEEASARAAEARFSVLSRAATLCSAFIVVLPANALHDQTVSRLLRLLEQRMPHVQRMLAVNRVPRRYLTKEIAREVHQLYRSSNLRRIYMAYNYDGPTAREHLPRPPFDLRSISEPPLPFFFRIDSETVVQPPEPVEDQDWLIRLGSQLQSNDLMADAIRSANAHLTTTVHRAMAVARSLVEDQNQQTTYLQQVIADACADFSLDPASPASQPRIRLQASRQVIQQIADSLERTAPWWARPGRWMQRIAEAGRTTVTGAVSWFRMPSWVSDRGNAIGDWVRGRFKRGESGRVVTADTLTDHLSQRDRKGVLGMDDSEGQREIVRHACQRAIERFQSESATTIDAEQVDALTRRIWAEMPVRQRLIRGVAPAGILFAPLLAVIMVPLDFGGSSVLVFASLKELLFAGAAGLGLALASSNALPHLAESESAWQQLADLIAVLTDELGFDRPLASTPTTISFGSATREVASSAIEPMRNHRPEVPGAKLALFQVDEGRAETIVKLLDAIERAQRT